MSVPAPVFAITGELSIYRAAELTAALLAWVGQQSQSTQLDVDLSAVSEMDSAGLQMLLALQRTAKAQAKRWRITQVSPAVQEVLTLTGLTHWLPPVGEH